MTLVVRDDLNVVMLPDADAPDIVTVRFSTYYASVRVHLRVRCTQINTDRRHCFVQKVWEDCWRQMEVWHKTWTEMVVAGMIQRLGRAAQRT